jgi:hypothetical protein
MGSVRLRVSDTPMNIFINMPLEEFKKVLAAIAKERPDVFDLIVITMKEQDEASKHFQELFERIKNESA